jgi:hypothetical protein
MAGDLDGVVAVPAIKAKLTRMKFVTERDRLSGLMSHINNRGMDCGKQTGCQIAANR